MTGDLEIMLSVAPRKSKEKVKVIVTVIRGVFKCRQMGPFSKYSVVELRHSELLQT